MKSKSKISKAKLLTKAKKIQEERKKQGLYSPNQNNALELLQSLQVHQIELEMQNDELKRLCSDLDTAKINYMNLYELAPVGYFTLKCDGIIMKTNLSGAKLFDMSRSELLGRRFDLFVVLDDRATFRDMLFRAFKSHTKEFSDIFISTALNQNVCLHLEAYCSEGEEECLLTTTNITDLKYAEKVLRESEAKYRLIADNATDVIWVYNHSKDKFTYISPSIFNLRGYTVEEVLNEKLEERLSLDSSPDQLDLIKSRAEEFVKNPHASNSYLDEIQQLCKNGDLIWVEITTKYYFNSDGDIEIVGVSRNIDDRKNIEKNIIYISYHDKLTGLYNRRYYEEELSRLDTERNLPISLILADINGLKLANDAFGHKAGDLLIKKFSDILKSECRSDEIIARIGGDEFIILLPCTNLSDVHKLIARITSRISNEVSEDTILSASFGVAIKQTMSQDMSQVFKEAEDDMYRHKLSEKASIRSNTIDLIMRTLFEKNDREIYHAERVSELCEVIARKLSFDMDHVNQIRLAGLMHDIGKIGISDSILNKTDELTEDEFSESMKHSEVGYRILSSVNEFSEIAKFVLEHHERWDGTGYPMGLNGEEISIEARIISLADAYDAMTSKRTYKSQLSKEEALTEIRRCSGSQFDPIISGVFIEYLLNEE